MQYAAVLKNHSTALLPYIKRHIENVWPPTHMVSSASFRKSMTAKRPSGTGSGSHLKTTATTDRPNSGSVNRHYAKAVRHSRRVWILKWTFPVAAVLAVLAFTGSTMISGVLPEGASIGELVVTDGKLIMRNPVMTGPVDDKRDYSISASRAVQELSAPEVIRLEDIVADFPVTEGDTALLNAISGYFNRDKEFLVLDQPFTVTTESGVTARLQDANIDVDAGTLKTQKRVDIETEQARIVAESLVMRDNGAEIVFERDVHMTVMPGAFRSASGAGNETQ